MPTKQRKYYITNQFGTPSGQTVMCAPEKAARMARHMGVRFMRHLPKPPTVKETTQPVEKFPDFAAH